MDAHDDMAFSYAKPMGVPKVFKMREEPEPEKEAIKKPVRKRRKTKRKKR